MMFGKIITNAEGQPIISSAPDSNTLLRVKEKAGNYTW